MLTQKKENPMAVRSKNALAAALLKLMMVRDFGEISISDIAARAGLARQTFYTNFVRKEDILLYLIRGLFDRCHGKLSRTPAPENLLIDYFLFWGGSRDFLSPLFRQGLGALFQDMNRAFFLEDTAFLDPFFTAEDWQLAYIKAGIAGITYELLYLWITEEQGLPVSVLNTLTLNLLDGKIFS